MPNGPDNRINPRYRVLGHAQIRTPTGTINCVVRDLSDTGAKLGVSDRAKLPPEFDLWLVQRKLKLRARLRWRRGEYAGVSFCAMEQGLKVLPPDPDKRFIVDA